jgi:hypothetical protein
VITAANSCRERKKTAILHTIFFHRWFPIVSPQTRPVLSLALPYIDDVELETLIEQRAALLERQLHAERSASAGPTAGAKVPPHAHDTPHTQRRAPGGPGTAMPGMSGVAGGGGRGQITVKFLEKKRRKAWIMKGEEEVCWECWTIKVTVAEPKTENGELLHGALPYSPIFVERGTSGINGLDIQLERAKVRQAMEQTLLAAVRKIMKYVNANKDHIPPITATNGNPFPYQITVNQKDAGWATRMGIY